MLDNFYIYLLHINNTCSFKWKSALCALGKPFYCSLAQPECPSGYTALLPFKQSCFKILDDVGTPVWEPSASPTKKNIFSDAKV